MKKLLILPLIIAVIIAGLVATPTYAMDQVLISGYNNPLSNSATEYNAISDGMVWNGTESNRKQLISAPGKLKNLYVQLSGTPGGGGIYTFTLMVNGANTTLEVAITGGTTGSDVSSEIDVSAGDEVSIRVYDTGATSTPYARWSFMFTGDNAKESNILGAARANSGTNGGYAQVNAYAASADAVLPEADMRVVIPTGGTIKNLYVKLNGAPGTGGDAWTFTLRLDSGGGLGDTALAVTITNAETAGNNIADDVAVSAGDIVTMSIVESVSATTRLAWWGFTFEATIDGESLILGGSNDNLNTGGTAEYLGLMNAYYARIWTTTEADRYQLGQATTLKKFYVLLSGAPNQGGDVADAYTFKVRLNSADPASGLSVTIADAATTGNDQVNSVTVTNSYDEVAISHQSADTPTAVDAYWGLVGYIAPAVAPTVTTNAATSVTSTTATLNGNVTATGDGNITEHWFVWGNDNAGDPGDDPVGSSWDNTWSESGSYGTGAFSHGVTSLGSVTKYYYRAGGNQSANLGWGDVVSFTTEWPDGFGTRKKLTVTALGGIGGTINVTNSSTAVVGNGTSFRDWIVGDEIQMPDSAWWAISAIGNETGITLSPSYTGGTLGGQSYDIRHVNYQKLLKILGAPDTSGNSTEVGYEPLGLATFDASDFSLDGSTLFMGDSSDTLWKSTDNGRTFASIFTIPEQSSESALFADRVMMVFVDSRDYIFVSGGSTNRVYRSTDAGASFDEVLNFQRGANDAQTWAMEEDPENNLYVVEYGVQTGSVSGGRLWKSYDDGANWDETPLEGAVSEELGTGNTTETTAANNATTNDMTLMPDPDSVGDAYYFGSYNQVKAIRVNVSTAGIGAGATITWKYWDGSSWSNLAGVTDGTNSFKNSGVGNVTFTMPSDWAETTVGAASTSYWIKAELTSGDYTTIPIGAQAWDGHLRNFDLRHLHAIRLNSYNNWLYVVGGEGYPSPDFESGADAFDVFRSKDYGLSWAKVLEGSTLPDLLGAGIEFIDDWVYIGGDIAARFSYGSDIIRFQDDGSGEPFTRSVVLEELSAGSIYWNSTKIGDWLVFVASRASDVADWESHVVRSSDGVNWEVVAHQSTTATDEFKGLATRHPGRGGKLYAQLLEGSYGMYFAFDDFWDVVGTGGNIDSEFDNLLFQNSSGTEMDYWRERIETPYLGGNRTADLLTGGTASADSVLPNAGTYAADKAFDDDPDTWWSSNNDATTWLKYDLGAGVTKIAANITLHSRFIVSGLELKDFTLEGSNNDSDWTILLTATAADEGSGAETAQHWSFNNNVAFRYYRVSVTSNYGLADYIQIREMQLFERVYRPARAYADVWVEFDYVTTSGSEFWFNYDSAAASDGGNGTNTFPLFDEFGDLSAWTQDSGSWSAGVYGDEGNTAYLEPVAANNYLRKAATFDNNFGVGTRVWPTEAGDAGANIGILFYAQSGNNDHIYYSLASDASQSAYYDGSLNFTETLSQGIDWNAWNMLRVSVSEEIVKSAIDQITDDEGTSLEYNGVYDDVGLVAHDGGKHYFDYIYVYDYAPEGVNIVWSAEESSAAAGQIIPINIY